LANGFISFYPKEEQGQNVGGTIVNGEYDVAEVTPGINRVQITITEPADPPAAPIGRSRSEVNKERLSHLKRRPSASRAKPPERPETTFEVAVEAGRQTLNVPIESKPVKN
jgi:hypothetical protein